MEETLLFVTSYGICSNILYVHDLTQNEKWNNILLITTWQNYSYIEKKTIKKLRYCSEYLSIYVVFEEKKIKRVLRQVFTELVKKTRYVRCIFFSALKTRPT